jgi:hypothetical protein
MPQAAKTSGIWSGVRHLRRPSASISALLSAAEVTPQHAAWPPEGVRLAMANNYDAQSEVAAGSSTET